MILKLIRQEFTEESTIGSLFLNDEFFCFVLEDKDRGLKDSDSVAWVTAKKIFGKTAIPYGRYKVSLTLSNRFKRVLPILHNVKGFEGIRIHRGNTANDSLGCLIVGFKKAYNQVFESTKAEEKLITLLSLAKDEIFIEIVKA